MKSIIICLCIAFAASVSFADQKDALALELVDLTGVIEVSLSSPVKKFDETMAKFRPRFTPDQYSEYKSRVASMVEKIKNDPEVKNEIAQIYKSHFTEEELQELVTLFRTPVWKKYKETHTVMSEEMISVVKKEVESKFRDEIVPFVDPIFKATKEN